MNQHVNRLEFENKKIPYVGLAEWVRVCTAFAEDLLEDSQMPVAPALGNPSVFFRPQRSPAYRCTPLPYSFTNNKSFSLSYLYIPDDTEKHTYGKVS